MATAQTTLRIRPSGGTALRGFTMLELLVTLLLSSIMILAVVPYFMADQRKAKDDNALQKAQMLDVAKVSMSQEKGYRARQDWSNASSDQAKYELLRKYLFEPPGQFTEYIPAGYTFLLRDLSNSTVVSAPGGKILNPPPPPVEEDPDPDSK